MVPRRITEKINLKFLCKNVWYNHILFVTLYSQNTTTMEYKIIEGSSPNEITKKVNDLIKEGWTPVGSHQVVIRREQNRYSGQQHMDTLNQLEYTQTMVKDTTKELVEVELMYMRTGDDLEEITYDLEGMRIEFERKLENL